MDTNTTVNEFYMASNQNMAYANGYIKGMLMDMHKDATSDRECEAIRHCIHVSNLFFLHRNHRDVGEISAGIYKVANRLALGQTLTIEVINRHNPDKLKIISISASGVSHHMKSKMKNLTQFALYADDENVMESTDPALLQMIVDYSKNNELCLSLENIK